MERNHEQGKIKIGLLFTLDYEIHGNGCGSFTDWVFSPTVKMLNLFDSYGAKATIMAEIGHYWAMKRYRHLFSNEIQLYEYQLADAVRRGHDVQLHLHPQWLDAEFIEEKWQLDYSRKSIQRLCNNYNEACYHLKKGKEDLQRLLKPVDPDYRCVCFRAGFLQMQPSINMIKALIDSGFLIDSSVSKGIKVNDNYRHLDYTSAYSKFEPWKINIEDICKNDEKSPIYEFPIMANNINIFKKIINFILWEKWYIKNKRIMPFMKSFMDSASPPNHIKIFSERFISLLSDRWDYADFCKMGDIRLIETLKMIIKQSKSNDRIKYIPIVLLGHSKDFSSEENLSRFLLACKNIEEIEFTTLQEGFKKYSNQFLNFS